MWEEAWRLEEGLARTRLQGLIQVAAGLHKASIGQPKGCVRLLEAGLSRLAGADRDPSLDRFARALEKTLKRARRWERGETEGPGEVPPLGPLEGARFVRKS